MSLRAAPLTFARLNACTPPLPRSNGYFTVNNGPGRHVEEPENMDFIAALTAGRVPRELEATAPGGELEVRLGLLRNLWCATQRFLLCGSSCNATMLLAWVRCWCAV